MTLKELRKSRGLTQKQSSEFLQIPLRTYKLYENDVKKQNTIKYCYMIEKLESYGYVDEEHGILSMDSIVRACKTVFDKYEVKYAYLFGSYAKGTETEKSDVDILVSTSVSGLGFYGIVESLREELKKNVDLLTVEQLNNNLPLVEEILSEGKKIYG